MPILHTRARGVLSLPHQAAYRLVHRYFAQGLPEILQCHPAGGAEGAGASQVRSIMVDSTPTVQGPPSTMPSIFPSRSSSMC